MISSPILIPESDPLVVPRSASSLCPTTHPTKERVIFKDAWSATQQLRAPTALSVTAHGLAHRTRRDGGGAAGAGGAGGGGRGGGDGDGGGGGGGGGDQH